MDKIRNLSVRKTILLYMAVSLLCSFLLSAWIVRIAEQTQKQIWWNYIDRNVTIEGNGIEKSGAIPRPSAYEMSSSDLVVSEICDFLQTYTILLLSFIGSCMAVFLFYNHKLKNPIAELKQASQNIARNNLDFYIVYKKEDEMGSLCQEFERMREQLVENNRKLWKTMEDEKALRAAIAHDIRSPLSVLKGYQEMLMEYLPNGKINLEKTMEMLAESKKQLERIDRFIEIMQKISSLESRNLQVDAITAKQLQADIQAELKILEKVFEKSILLQIVAIEEVFYGDKEIILEVTENLLSNALRYAKKEIELIIIMADSKLKICVKDDGNGFLKNTEDVTKAFYQQNVKDSLKHTGMGMYLSRLYCEKHGGTLFIKNQLQKGASVTAVFYRIV